jgi:hypothetical protein
MASQATRSSVAHGPLGGLASAWMPPDRSTDAMRWNGCWVATAGYQISCQQPWGCQSQRGALD